MQNEILTLTARVYHAGPLTRQAISVVRLNLAAANTLTQIAGEREQSQLGYLTEAYRSDQRA